MKKFLMIALTLCYLIPTNANAGIFGVYIAPKAIGSLTETGMATSGISDLDTSDFVWGGALAVGYDFNDIFSIPLRAELEWNMQSQSKDTLSSGTVSDLMTNIGTQNLFANIYYDFHNFTPLTPYVGGGIGLSFINFEANQGSTSFKDNTTSNFAWHADIGVALSILPSIALDLSYRYNQFGEAKTGGNIPITTDVITAHQAVFAIRFTF